LGREPESSDVIEGHRNFDSIYSLRRALLQSEEFITTQRPIAVMGEKWVCAPVFAGRFLMWLDLGDRYVSCGCLYDDYEPVETEAIRTYVRPGDRVCDIGANIGWHTLALADRVGETGVVYAFEPRRPTFDYLTKTINQNGLGAVVKLFGCGLWDRKCVSQLAWAPNTDNPGGSSINEDDAEACRQTIELERIDNLVEGKIDFIKIDIEGAEFRALANSSIVEESRPIVLSEILETQLMRLSSVSADEYLQLFRRRGYVCISLNDGQKGLRINRASELNREVNSVLFVPSERADD
jgi:FkbM family methyltransferase